MRELGLINDSKISSAAHHEPDGVKARFHIRRLSSCAFFSLSVNTDFMGYRLSYHALLVHSELNLVVTWMASALKIVSSWGPDLQTHGLVLDINLRKTTHQSAQSHHILD